MSIPITLGLVAIMGFMFVFNAVTVWAVESNTYKKYRLRRPEFVFLDTVNKHLRISLNGVFALSLYFGYTYFFYDFFISTADTNLVRALVDVLAILLIADFLYYLMHRAFHTPILMKYVHGRHHRVKNPTAADGLYLNPWDNFLGTTVFFVGIAIVGPVSPTAYLVVIFVYLTINNINHTGLELPYKSLRLFNFWARKHDIHHGVDVRKNFAQIFPIWDLAFGTYK